MGSSSTDYEHRGLGQFGPAGYLVGLEAFALLPEPGSSRLLWIRLLVGWLLRQRPTVANPRRLR